jgi:hypothetical protein
VAEIVKMESSPKKARARLAGALQSRRPPLNLFQPEASVIAAEF